MIETQLKTLIKSIALTNELLTTLINNNSAGGPIEQPGIELPTPAEQAQQVQPETQTPVPGNTPAQNPGTGAAPAEPVAGGTPSPSVESQHAAISLQERIMYVSQATSNPMLGMQFLAQWKVSAFSELTPEQIAQTDVQLGDIAVNAGVTL